MAALVGLRGLDSGDHDGGAVEGAGRGDESRAADLGEAVDQGTGGTDARGDLDAVSVEAAGEGVPGEGALEGHLVDPYLGMKTRYGGATPMSTAF